MRKNIYFPSWNNPYENRGDNEPVCIADEVPFEIPESWEWIRLGRICEIGRGGSPRPIKAFLTDNKNGINWIKIGDSDKGGKYINSTKEKIIPEGVSKSRMVYAGDFLLTNSMSFGRPYILNVDGCIHDGWLVLSGYQKAYNQDYLYYMLSSRFAYYQFCDVVSGAVVKNLNSDKVGESLFPLPPLSEQHRIVSKIEELLPLITEYEKAETQLTALNTSFPAQLKKSILQQAIQGKLVPQDPDDEPASKLLERIRAEKQELIKAGKIKKDKNESVIFKRDNSHYELCGGVERCIDDEIPFEVPESWVWCRLNNICTKLVDGDHNPPKGETSQTQYLMLSSTNINNDSIVELEKVRYLKKELFEKEDLRTKVEKGDIFFTSVGSLGRSCIYNGGYNICFQRSVSVIKTLIYNAYLKIVFDSVYFQDKVNREATGTAQKGFYLNQLSESLIPIPPLYEQNRIESQIIELFNIIDQILQ